MEPNGKFPWNDQAYGDFFSYIHFFSTKKYKLVNVNQPNSKSTEIEPGL